jgi:hypothetical protein
VRHLHFAEGLSERAIADRLSLARGTVGRALAAESPPAYSRPSARSVFDGFEADVRSLLAAFPSMPATVIAERVGWTGSPSWFRKRVAVFRPEFAPRDPADRLEHRPGEQGQCDLWFPPARIPLGAGQVGSPPVLVIVASFSRFITARMLPTRTTPDLLAGMWSLLSGQLDAVPRRLLWDNEAGIGRRGRLADSGGRTHWDVGDEAGPGQAVRSGDEGDRRAGERVPGDLVHAWPLVHLAHRLQPAARRLAAGRQPAAGPVAAGPDRSTCSTRTAPACCRSRRSPRPSGTGSGSGWAGTTSSGSRAVTTPSTR